MILELDLYDYLTVNPAYIAANHDLWLKMGELFKTNRVKFLMVAASWKKEEILAAFERQTIPDDQLPQMLGIYKALTETHLENSTKNSRFTRVFCILDTQEPLESVARILKSYGLLAHPLEQPVLPPFAQITSHYDYGISAEGNHWAMIRSESAQTGVINPTALHGLFNLEFPVWATITLENLTTSQAKALVRRKAGTIGYTIRKNEDEEVRASALDVKVAADEIRGELYRGASLHHVTLSVLVGGSDKKELRERAALIRSACGWGMRSYYEPIQTAVEMFQVEKVLPINGKSTLVTTRGVVALLASPLTYRRRTDSTGVIIGYDMTQAPAHLHLFNPRYPSYNAVLLGQTGSGKTFAFQVIALRHLLMGCRIVMVDPQGNIDWSWLGEESCQTIQLGTENGALNILDAIHDDLPNQVEHVLSLLKLMGIYGDDPQDRLARAILDRCLIDLYRPIWGTGIHPQLKDLGRRLELGNDEDEVSGLCKTLVLRLRTYTEGSQSSLFANRSNIDLSLSKAVTIFDISRLPSPEKEGNLRASLLSILTGSISQAIRQLRRGDSPAKTTPIIWFIDEMGVLMRDPVIASNTSYEYKTARARRVSMVVADQDLQSLLGREDDYGTKHGQAMIANAGTVLIFKQRQGEEQRVKEAFPELPETLAERIYLQGLGQCVLQTAEDVTQITIHPSEFEKIIFSSRLQDREKREGMIAKFRATYQEERGNGD